MEEIQNFKNSFEIIVPEKVTSPLVISSPHSGNYYPPYFFKMTNLSINELRSSEDCYIDEIFSTSSKIGAPLIKAIYSRTYIDLNREPYELDPTMFEKTLPSYINDTSNRVLSGIGTIAKYSGNQKKIYKNKLDFNEIKNRINMVYYPYHQNLKKLINNAIDKFGFCLLLDCHSMPSVGLPLNYQQKKIDITLGDLNGASCSEIIIKNINYDFKSIGLNTTFNNPYAGGFITKNYGKPLDGVHVVQIEVNREIYVDELSFEKKPSFSNVKKMMNIMLENLSHFVKINEYNINPQKLSAE